MAKIWEPAFPHLGAWKWHSKPTRRGGRNPRYNCFAFAAGDNTKRWEPDPGSLYYWPISVVREYTIAAFIEAYQTIGYELCANSFLDPTCEKIVIYATAFGTASHAARQLANGKWISKLGDEDDIIHDTPEALRGADYGQPICFMGRSSLRNARRVIIALLNLRRHPS